MEDRITQLFKDLETAHPDDWDYYRAVCHEVLCWYRGTADQIQCEKKLQDYILARWDELV